MKTDDTLRAQSTNGETELSYLIAWLIIMFCQVWRCTPLMPVLRRQRQVDLCKTEASLVYAVSSRTARGIERDAIFFKN